MCLRKILPVFFVIVFAVNSYGYDPVDKILELKNENAELKEKIAKLEQENKRLIDRIQELSKKNSGLRKENKTIEELQEKVKLLENELLSSAGGGVPETEELRSVYFDYRGNFMKVKKQYVYISEEALKAIAVPDKKLADKPDGTMKMMKMMMKGENTAVNGAENGIPEKPSSGVICKTSGKVFQVLGKNDMLADLGMQYMKWGTGSVGSGLDMSTYPYQYISTRPETIYVEGADTTNIANGQSWEGIVVTAGTYQYEAASGGVNTIQSVVLYDPERKPLTYDEFLEAIKSCPNLPNELASYRN